MRRRALLAGGAVSPAAAAAGLSEWRRMGTAVGYDGAVAAGRRAISHPTELVWLIRQATEADAYDRATRTYLGG